jgi:glycosyltransferase involved in cell wall biosynthesis
MKKRKILIFIAHYLPGQNIGGPLNSVLNIVQNLKEDYDFFIITSNKDMGENVVYKNLSVNVWLDVEGAKVMYLKNGLSYFYNVYKALRNDIYDVLYLNSFFDFQYSIYIILLKYLKLFPNSSVIVAPRGELVRAALTFRKWKKKLFLKCANFLGLYRGVLWHSTADFETLSIENCFKGSKIQLACVIANSKNHVINIDNLSFDLVGNFLKVIFLSRISKEKNLIYALNVLTKVSCRVEFHIYGPIEEMNVWKNCLEVIDAMPENIKVRYGGIVPRDLVKSYFAKYDLFLFPTHAENYGHVINESLSVGTPVLVSDNTPWKSLYHKGLGWDVNLRNQNEFIRVLNELYIKKGTEGHDFRSIVKKSYLEYIDSNKILQENLRLFN